MGGWSKTINMHDATYPLKRFHEKLKPKYKDHVYFVKSSDHVCKGELVCLKEMTDYILRKLKEDGSVTNEKIVKAAAKIMKEEFREMKFSKDFYPSIDEITSSEKGEKWVQNQLNVHEIVGSIEFETAKSQSVYCPNNEAKKCYCTDPVWCWHGY